MLPWTKQPYVQDDPFCLQPYAIHPKSDDIFLGVSIAGISKAISLNWSIKQGMEWLYLGVILQFWRTLVALSHWSHWAWEISDQINCKRLYCFSSVYRRCALYCFIAPFPLTKGYDTDSFFFFFFILLNLFLERTNFNVFVSWEMFPFAQSIAWLNKFVLLLFVLFNAISFWSFCSIFGDMVVYFGK